MAVGGVAERHPRAGFRSGSLSSLVCAEAVNFGSLPDVADGNAVNVGGLPIVSGGDAVNRRRGDENVAGSGEEAASRHVKRRSGRAHVRS